MIPPARAAANAFGSCGWLTGCDRGRKLAEVDSGVTMASGCLRHLQTRPMEGADQVHAPFQVDGMGSQQRCRSAPLRPGLVSCTRRALGRRQRCHFRAAAIGSISPEPEPMATMDETAPLVGDVLAQLEVDVLSPDEVLEHYAGSADLQEIGDFLFDADGARVQEVQQRGPQELEGADELPPPVNPPEETEEAETAETSRKVPWCKECNNVGHERKSKGKCPLHPGYTGDDKGHKGPFNERPSYELYQQHLQQNRRVPQAPNHAAFDGKEWYEGPAEDWVPPEATAPEYTLPKKEFHFSELTPPYELWHHFCFKDIEENLVKWTQQQVETGKTQLASMPYFSPLFAHSGFEMTRQHLHAMVGTYMMNGLHPYPSMDHYWSADKVAFPDTLIEEAWNPLGGRRAFHLVKRVLRFNDPVNIYDASRAREPRSPFTLVLPFLDNFRHKCETTCVLGTRLSLDEIDVPFQGRFAAASRIKYKRAGDGMLLDGVACAETGYLFSFWPRADPTLSGDRGASLPDELSPLGKRCLYLLTHEELANANRHVYCDNLFTSLKFAYHVREKAGMHLTGVARMNGRGLPQEVKQVELSGKAAEEAKGKVKIAHLKIDDNFCALAVSVYDSKPVHLITTAQAAVNMVTKKRVVLRDGEKVEITYERLDTIEQYNHFMNGIDRTDQMRFYYDLSGPYQRHRKWTWAIFEFVLKQSVVQAFLVHKMLVAEAARAWEVRKDKIDGRLGPDKREEAIRRLGKPPIPLTHLEFQKQIGLALLCPRPSAAAAPSSPLRRSPRKQGARAKRSAVTGYVDSCKRRKAAPDFQLAIDESGRGSLLDDEQRIPGDHFIEVSTGKGTRCCMCQLHNTVFPGERRNKGKFLSIPKNEWQDSRPKAKFVCNNKHCGSRKFCSTQCWNTWHFRCGAM